MVRHKKNVAIDRSSLDDFLGVPAGADDIAERFHPCAAIDVSDHVIIFAGVLFQKRGQGRRRTGFRKRTTGIEIGQNDALGRIDDFRGLGHEVHATEKNNFGVGFRRLITQPERITDEVGYLLNFPHLIIVREDNGVAFAFQFRDIRRQINAVINCRAYH